MVFLLYILGIFVVYELLNDSLETSSPYQHTPLFVEKKIEAIFTSIFWPVISVVIIVIYSINWIVSFVCWFKDLVKKGQKWLKQNIAKKDDSEHI